MIKLKKKIAKLLCVSMIICSMQEGIFAENLFDDNQQKNVELVNVNENNYSINDAENLVESIDEMEPTENIVEEFEDDASPSEADIIEDDVDFENEPEEDNITFENEIDCDIASESEIEADCDITTESELEESDLINEEDIKEVISSESELLESKVETLTLFGINPSNEYTIDDFLNSTVLSNVVNGKDSIEKLTMQKGGSLSGTNIYKPGSNDTGLYQDGNELIIYIDNSDTMYLGTIKFNVLPNVTYISGFDCITATNSITDYSDLFKDMHELVFIDVTGFDTSYATTMENMFYGCEKLQEIYGLDSFDTQNVVSMKAIFRGCNKIQRLDLSSFYTPNLENADEMFYKTFVLRLIDMSNFSVSSITSAYMMFREIAALKTLRLQQEFYDLINTDNPISQAGIYFLAPLGDSSIYEIVDSTNKDKRHIKFDINAYSFFSDENKIKGKRIDKNELDNPSAIDDQWIDKTALISEPIISNASRSIIFDGWYEDARYTKEWDFANDIPKYDMTLYAKWLLDGYLTYHLDNGETWNIPNPSMASGILYYDEIKLPKATDITYDNHCLSGWELRYSGNGTSVGSPSDIFHIFASTDVYPIWENGIAYNIKTDLLDAINDKSVITEINIQKGGNIPTTGLVKEVSNLSHTGIYLNNGNVTIYLAPCDELLLETGSFAGFENVVNINGLQYINSSSLIDFSNMFNGCEKLENVDLSTFDTASATNMSNMFKDCKSLTILDLSSFDTNNVTNMSHMFENDDSLTKVAVSNSFKKASNITDWFKGCKITDVYYNGGVAVTFCKDVYNGTAFTEVEIDGTLNNASAKIGECISSPSDIKSRAGFTFLGWYKDKLYTNKWDFSNDRVTGEMTLYAKWCIDIEFYFEDGDAIQWVNPPRTRYEYSGNNSIIVQLPVKSDIVAPDIYCESPRWYNENYYDESNRITTDSINIFNIRKICLVWEKYRVVKYYDGINESDILTYSADQNVISVSNAPSNQKLIASKSYTYCYDYVFLYKTEYPSVSRSGYNLLGWYTYNATSKKLTKFISNNRTFELLNVDELKLYAVWQKNTTTTTTTKTTITYTGGNGGNGGGGGGGSRAAGGGLKGPAATPKQSDAKIVQSRTTKDVTLASTNVEWNYDPIKGTWSLNIDKNNPNAFAANGFIAIASVDPITGQVKNDVYNFDENGNMVTGWAKDATGAMYYFDANQGAEMGKMAIGWKQVGTGMWYFFGTDGKLLTNTITPDGLLVGTDGLWQDPNTTVNTTLQTGAIAPLK